VLISNSGFTGGSKGAFIPVKFFISPFRAFLYNPFVSLFSHVSKEAFIYTSIISSLPIIFFTLSLIAIVGLTKQFIVTIHH